jgi:hypothetical protein
VPVLSFVDGVTDLPVFPDQVTPPNPTLGSNVTVALDDHFVREQKWTGAPMALWPLEGGGAYGRGHYFQELVYGGEAHRPLIRWAGMSYTVVMGLRTPELDAQAPEIKEKLRGVFGDFTEAGGPAFAWSEAQTGDLTVKIDPDDTCLQPSYVSCARWWQSGNAITRAELVFRSRDWAFDNPISMHSMGHVVGLSDWPLPGAAMNHSGALNPLERAAIHMMYRHRLAGNVEPDRDPGFVANSRAASRMYQAAH